jgi:glucose/arabinose dehydrogenase
MGTCLVAETNAPKRPKDEEGVKAKVMKKMRGKAGAGDPSANRITLLRDADGDGIAETRSVLVENLYSPFGMALVGSDFYVANSDGIVKFPYRTGETRIAAAPVPVTDLPGGERNHHWTKNIIADRDGARLYATVGSNSNVAEHGMAEEEGRAAIWEVDLKTGTKRVYATGLRNPNGMAWEPSSGALWTVANERDELGNDLVPDYLTSVKQGVFYGWPYSYYGNMSMCASIRRGRTWSRGPSHLTTPGRACRCSWACICGRVGTCAAAQSDQGNVHRRTRLLESRSAVRLQSGVRAIRQWTSVGRADRGPDRIRERCRSSHGTSRRRRHRRQRGVARGG